MNYKSPKTSYQGLAIIIVEIRFWDKKQKSLPEQSERLLIYHVNVILHQIVPLLKVANNRDDRNDNDTNNDV